MKKTILLKIILCMSCVLLLLVLNYTFFQLYVDAKLALTSTYIAARDLPPRTKIEEGDLIEVKISDGYQLDQTYINKEDIIGKYTDIQGMIPAGSPFYKTMLHDLEELGDQATTQLKPGQTSFTMEIDVAKLGSIVAGQRVDIHLSIERREEPAITGKLIENARVLSIKDHKGLELDDPDSTGIPYLIELAINASDVEYVTFAEAMGNLRIFPSENAYDTSLEASICIDSNVYQYLEQYMENEEESPPE